METGASQLPEDYCYVPDRAGCALEGYSPYGLTEVHLDRHGSARPGASVERCSPPSGPRSPGDPRFVSRTIPAASRMTTGERRGDPDPRIQR